MHKIVSLSLDERVVDLLDDEIIREPDCHNRSQLIRKIIQQYFAAKGNVARKIETETNLGELWFGSATRLISPCSTALSPRTGQEPGIYMRAFAAAWHRKPASTS